MLSTVRKGFGLAGSMSASIGRGPDEAGGAQDTAPPLPVPRQPGAGAVLNPGPSPSASTGAATANTAAENTAVGSTAVGSTAAGNPVTGSWLERLEQLERQPTPTRRTRQTRRARRKTPRGSVWLSSSVWLSWPGRPAWLAKRSGPAKRSGRRGPRWPWGRRAGVLAAGTATALLLMGGASTLMVTRDSGRTASPASADWTSRPDAALAVTTLERAGTGPDAAVPAPMTPPQPAVPALAAPVPAAPAVPVPAAPAPAPAAPAAPAPAAPAPAATSGASTDLPRRAPRSGERLAVPALTPVPHPTPDTCAAHRTDSPEHARQPRQHALVAHQTLRAAPAVGQPATVSPAGSRRP
jgi:hypothetical protein